VRYDPAIAHAAVACSDGTKCRPEKRTAAVALERPFATQRVLQCFHSNKAIQWRLHRPGIQPRSATQTLSDAGVAGADRGAAECGLLGL